MPTSLRTLRTFTSSLLTSSPWHAPQCRLASSASSSRWTARQKKDVYVKESKVAGLKSRAGFKLLQMNDKYKLFKSRQTVLDLGYAPGAWSQVAIDRTRPGGRVLGVDILPSPPPKGCSTIQGNFLSPAIRQQVREFLLDPDRGRLKEAVVFDENGELETYMEQAREEEAREESAETKKKPVDVVLSDMCEPWELPSSQYKRHLRDTWNRLMNTSGIRFRDHAGSMDLCNAALGFALEVLKPGGHFVCKFYAGEEDKALEKRLKKVFTKVYREKPESSRSESREMFFVALKLKKDVGPESIEGM